MFIPLTTIEGWHDFYNKQQGKRIGISLFPGFKALLTIQEEGLHGSLSDKQEADLTITIKPSVAVGLLFNLSFKEMGRKRMVKVHGDLHLAESLTELNPSMGDRLKDVLQHLFGNELSDIIIEHMRAVHTQLKEHVDNSAVDATSYALAGRDEVELFYSDIRSLSNRIQKLEKTIHEDS